MRLWRTHPNFFLTMTATIATNALVGSAYAFGPAVWRSSPSFEIITRVLPFHDTRDDFTLVGVAFLSVALLEFVGLLTDFRVARRGLALGAGLAMGWFVGLASAAAVGKLQGGGAPVWLFFAVCQLAQASEPTTNPDAGR